LELSVAWLGSTKVSEKIWIAVAANAELCELLEDECELDNEELLEGALLDDELCELLE